VVFLRPLRLAAATRREQFHLDSVVNAGLASDASLPRKRVAGWHEKLPGPRMGYEAAALAL
jgi:hypothetical protein